MNKRYRVFGLTILLLGILVSFSGCTTIEKIEKKLGWRTEYFEYLNSSNVDQVSIQSTRDLGFKFIVTEEATKKSIYNVLTKAQLSGTKNNLDPDYIIEFQVEDETYKFYFVVDDGEGNLYNDDGDIYTVSDTLVDGIIQNLSFTRQPKYFESIYYNTITKVLETAKDSLSDANGKIGVNIQGDVDCLKYVYSDDIESFLKSASKIYSNIEMVNNNTSDFDVVFTLKNRGYDTTTYKTSITVSDKVANTEHVYYVVAYYEYKKWNITVSEPDVKPSDW